MDSRDVDLRQVRASVLEILELLRGMPAEERHALALRLRESPTHADQRLRAIGFDLVGAVELEKLDEVEHRNRRRFKGAARKAVEKARSTKRIE